MRKTLLHVRRKDCIAMLLYQRSTYQTCIDAIWHGTTQYTLQMYLSSYECSPVDRVSVRLGERGYVRHLTYQLALYRSVSDTINSNLGRFTHLSMFMPLSH